MPRLPIRAAFLLPVALTAAGLSGCSLSGHHHASPPPTKNAELTFVRMFAASYVNVLAGSQSAGSLPWSTPAVRSVAQAIPPRYQLGAPRVERIAPQAGTPHAYTMTVADGSKQLFATVGLGRQKSRWVAVSMVPPDYAQVFQPPHAVAPVPTAARPAVGAVQRFLAVYIPCQYGRATCRTAPGITARVRAQLAHVSVPASLHNLHATVSNPTVSRTRVGWRVYVDVRDPHSTYVVTVSTQQLHHRWQITDVS